MTKYTYQNNVINNCVFKNFYFLIQYVHKLRDMSLTLHRRDKYEIMCKTLLETVFRHDDLFEKVKRDISRMEFIPQSKPPKQFEQLHPIKHCSDRPFTCFHGAILHKHGGLVWTQIPILPAYAIPSWRSSYYCDTLDVIQKPSLATVIKNIVY